MLIIGLVVTLPLVGFANGEGPDDPPKKKSQEDSVSIGQAENKIIDEIVFPDFQKTSPTVYPTKMQTGTKKVAKSSEKEVIREEEDNSAMSFNFIYYIIDTFKFTDPLE